MEPVAGMAWPIVMRMKPPEGTIRPDDGITLNSDEPPITAMLGDALAATVRTTAAIENSSDLSESKAEPSAIPIYDPSRQAGTIVFNELPTKNATTDYNLWVETGKGDAPTYVGKLPEYDLKAANIFDFSLGAGAPIPTGFLLTQDQQGQPVPPSAANTVLKGPQ